MLNLPPTIMMVLMPFAPLFHVKTWQKVPVLLIGTGILFQSTDDLDDLGIAHDERLVVVRDAEEVDLRDFRVGVGA